MVNQSRRNFISTVGKTIAIGGFSGLSVSEAIAKPIEQLADNIPTTTLGRTGWKTKILGTGLMFFGGEGSGAIPGGLSYAESDVLLNTALDLGVNFFEVGRLYGEAEARLGRITPNRRDEMFIVSKVVVKDRPKEKMLKAIEQSLLTLKTDYIDAYSFHDCWSLELYREATGENGSLEGLKQAQKEGKIRFIGLTTHDVPTMMTALRSGEFDVCGIPYNALSREFERALDLAAKLNIGTYGIKPFGLGSLLQISIDHNRRYKPENPGELPESLTVEECLRFQLSHPGLTVAIPGSCTTEYLKQNAAIAATFKPLTPEERKDIIAKAERIAGGICGICSEKPCEKVCPNQVPISFCVSTRSLQRRAYGVGRLLKKQYAMLPHDYLDCDSCGECEKVCPQKFKIRDEMKSLHSAFAG